MPIGAHEYFSCGCSIYTFQAICTLYLCRGHNDLKPRLLERGYNPRQHVQSIGFEFAPGPAPAFNEPLAHVQAQYGNQFNFPQTHPTVQPGNFRGFAQVQVGYESNYPRPHCDNVPHANFQGAFQAQGGYQTGFTQNHGNFQGSFQAQGGYQTVFTQNHGSFQDSVQAQAGYQTRFPQNHGSFQNTDFQRSPDNGPSFAALMTQSCSQAQEEEDNESGDDLNQSEMGDGDDEGSQNDYTENDNDSSQSIEDADPDINDAISPDALPANNSENGSEPDDAMETANPEDPFRVDDIQDNFLNASVPFLSSVMTATRNASTPELQHNIQATANALYEAIKNGLDEATSLRDIDVNCERANVKHWIQDIKEGRSTLEDMEMGLWLSGEGKDLGRQMNAEKIKDRILRECMETLSKNL